MVAKAGEAFFELTDLSGKMADLPGLREPEVEIAAGDVVQGKKFLLDLIRHGDQIFRPVPEKHAFFRQGYAEAVSGKQFLAKLIFQSLQSFGQGGLRHMQQICRAGHILFSGNCQEIS